MTLLLGLAIGVVHWGITASYPPIQVIAHRGARSLAPENTLAAGRLAWELGAEAWELDVRITRDGELVVLHDETLIRTTNAAEIFPDRAPWRVQEFTLEEIRRLDAGSWFIREDPFGTLASGELDRKTAERYAGEKVPTLREALSLTRELGWWVNVEIKSPSSFPPFFLSPADREVVQKTVALVKELQLTDRVLISSFNHALIRYLGELARETPGALLVTSLPPDPLAYTRSWGAVALNPKLATYYSLQGKDCALKEAGIAIYVWTVNEVEDLSRLARAPCIAGIITDWPQRLLSLLGRGPKGR